ncbi:uncharacterized protein LOC116657488 [Camelus ferus]|uniref:Uncharacterized protein LOC116657488 n=1 Tax=Camelus ferus TaxID=419612 RepID=A0A8B8RCK3_CAMFR|nr:uncharacterized protein LOC116657488 [Camelus ferus]
MVGPTWPHPASPGPLRTSLSQSLCLRVTVTVGSPSRQRAGDRRQEMFVFEVWWPSPHSEVAAEIMVPDHQLRAGHGHLWSEAWVAAPKEGWTLTTRLDGSGPSAHADQAGASGLWARRSLLRLVSPAPSEDAPARGRGPQGCCAGPSGQGPWPLTVSGQSGRPGVALDDWGDTSPGEGTCFGCRAWYPRLVEGVAAGGAFLGTSRGEVSGWREPWAPGLKATAAEVSSLAPPRPRAWPAALPLTLGCPSRPGRELQRGRIPGGWSQGFPGQTGVASGQLGWDSSKTSCPPSRCPLTSSNRAGQEVPAKSFPAKRRVAWGQRAQGLLGVGSRIKAKDGQPKVTPRSRCGRSGGVAAPCLPLSETPIFLPWIKPKHPTLRKMIVNSKPITC